MTNTANSSRDAPENGSNTAVNMKNEAKAKIKATAKEGARAVESRAQSMAAMGMAQAEEHLRGLSRALESSRSELEQDDHPLAGAFGTVHDGVDAVARGIADRDPGELMDEAQRLARQNPWMFIGGCFVGGIVLARFLKASDPEPQLAGRGAGPAWLPPTTPQTPAYRREHETFASPAGSAVRTREEKAHE